jgi:hypothetical protein
VATKTAKGTAGFVDKGVYGGVVTITGELLGDIAEHHPNREGMKLSIWHVTDADNTDTLTTGIDSIVAVAWQADDATDDDCRWALTTQATGILTCVATQANSGWLWILHKGY